MTFLALEFSSDVRSVAIARDGRVLSRAEESGGRSTRAFALIEHALAQAAIQREDVEAIAVGIGPGSYTGIRVALSVAQGWQLARRVRLLGVGAVDCLAARAAFDGVTGLIHTVIDAQRNELYHASFEIGDGAFKQASALRLVGLEEARSLAAGQKVVCGTDLQRHFPEARILTPDAAALAQVASSRNDFLPGDQLQPIYLREVSFVKAPPSRVIAMD